jgi:hypothetical protein
LTPDGLESGGVSDRCRHGSSSLRFSSTSGAGATSVELRMRRSPSMVPAETGHDTYLVLEDLGRFGRVWRETAEANANHETLIRDQLDDQYSRPMRIVAFNTAEGWSRDVTVDMADELRRRFAECDYVPVSVEEFLDLASR